MLPNDGANRVLDRVVKIMMTRQRIIRVALLNTAAASLMVFPLFAALTGNLFGSVSNPQGLPIENAKITVGSLGAGALRTVDAGPSGDFSALQLEVGDYKVRIEKPGFRTVSTNVSVRSGETTKLDVALSRATRR
jgi:hypothetical protein